MKKTIALLLFLGTAVTGLSQETYTLSDKSALTIDGTSTLHEWTVTANTMEGTVQQDGDIVNAVDFSVAVADILSDRAAAMDNKMHEALKKEEHPKVSFSVSGMDAAVGENKELKGKLNIAGVENEVSVPANITRTDGTLRIAGEKKITLKDYGMEPPTAMFGSIVVGDDVTVKFDLVFTK